MRIVFVLVLALGVGLAGFAVYMAQAYISASQQAVAAAERATRPNIETVTAYVAARAMRYGEPLTREDVRAAEWPARAVPEGTFTDIDTLFPENSAPRVVLRAMEPNEPILAVKVSQPGADAGITSRLSRGMRAFTIRVDVTTGVSGFLRPGDVVDVYWTGRVANTGEMTRLIESGVRLIAIDQDADPDRSSTTIIARTVTVEATPTQVAALAQAQSTGRLSLSLLGLDEERVSEAIEVDQRRLLGIELQQEEPVAEVAPPAPPVCTVRTRRGSEVVEIQIPCTN